IAVPFKGPVLAENVFGDVTLRRYLDLDILISKNDAAKAVELLLDNGFIPEEETFPTGVGRGAYLEKVVWVSLIHPEKHISVDLQWDISNRFTNLPITMEAMSERLELVELTGREVVSLPVEELLCYLCLHGTKHRWLALDYVCCVAELVRVRKDIDWQYVEQYAKKIHCVNVLFLGLLLARNILGAELPSSIEAKIGKENNLNELAEKICDGLFSDYRETMVVSEKFDPFLFQIKDSFMDRIVYLVKVVFIPSKEDLRLFNVPESFSFLRYILRPLRLIKKYCNRRYKTSTNKS
ncbi:MAG: nucleotidyltransferase family protein, partial [Desulfobulbaceae bacterium]|nr:nucleotidyltransferase family protein [Desulfobulbaceae bacterium]